MRNITRKINGINSFISEDLRAEYCIDTAAAGAAGCEVVTDVSGVDYVDPFSDCDSWLLNPASYCEDPSTSYAKNIVPAFSTCKADCPGGISRI